MWFSCVNYKTREYVYTNIGFVECSCDAIDMKKKSRKACINSVNCIVENCWKKINQTKCDL